MGDYIVQPSDTAKLISKKMLGDENRWPEIVSLNGLTDRPGPLFVGETLVLPNAGQAPPGLPRLPAESIQANIVPADTALARGFLFVIFEQLPEIGAGKIIRKVLVIPRDFSLSPENPMGNLTPAEHALAVDKGISQFLSASNRPFGAPSIDGRPLILDVDKIKKAGGVIHTVEDVVRDLARFAAENPSTQAQVNRLVNTIKNIEGEMLIEPGPSIPPGELIDWATPGDAAKRPGAPHNAYIRSAEDLWQEYVAGKKTRAELQEGLAKLEKSYAQARILGRIGRGLTVVGIVITVNDVIKATQQSINQNSIRPIGKEAIRQVGGWGGAAAGGKIGFGIGAAFGIETGPGAIATGALGAIVFGALGYFGANWLADQISPN